MSQAKDVTRKVKCDEAESMGLSCEITQVL